MDPNMISMLSPEELDLLWEGPAMEPPPGASVDFENPGGVHQLAYFVLIFGGVLGAISVVLRLISRRLLRKIWLEDYLFIAALGLYGGLIYTTYSVAIWPGFRVHQWNLQLKALPNFIYLTHIGSIFYGLIIMLLKTAILLNWVHIFVPTGVRNSMFWISHILIWTNILFYGIGTMVEIFQCTPREKIWNPLFVGGSCPIDMDKHMLASGVINLISDLIILILPQRIIWGLNVTRQRKIQISVLFAIGLFACISAIIRLVYLLRMLEAEDLLYTQSELALWSIAEITAGFLIMGLPSAPKVASNIPGSASFISFIRSVSGQSKESKSSQVNSRRGLPSWYKPKSQPRRPRDPFHITGDEESQHDMTMSLDNVQLADDDSQHVEKTTTRGSTVTEVKR